jgi:transcriptional regulator with XRE-family HTH domain
MSVVPVGKRIQRARELSGKSRAVLGGLLGMSTEWVKAVEAGRLLPPRLPMLVRIAEVLSVPDLAEFLGGTSLPLDVFSATEHPALTAVRRAVDTAPLGSAEGRLPNLAHVATRLNAGWRTRDTRSDHRSALGELLPGLIEDASIAVAHPDCPDRHRAQVLYASTLNLTQMFAAYQGDGNLVWRLTERSLATARASGDHVAIGQAAWFLVQALREAGKWDSAHSVTDEALRLLHPVRTQSPESGAAWAAMAFHSAITHAREGSSGTAWHWFDRGQEVAEALPADWWSSPTSASPKVVAIHGVTVAVELRQAGSALRWAQRIDPDTIPARPRRSRHLVEVARAHAMRRDPHSVAEHLTLAVSAAAETPRWNREARALVRDLRNGPPSVQDAARELSHEVGLVA